MSADQSPITIGVLALQGAFEEHQALLESLRLPCGRAVTTRQVRTPEQLDGIDGVVFPGGESTAMGLIGSKNGIWDALKDFVRSGRPVWGTCAGMILLAERCVGASAVIENGQALIGGVDVLVCRNYFGSQISSFEMATPPPPGFGGDDGDAFPGVFIRAPAILSAGDDVEVLGKVVATPCRQAAVVLQELEKKIEAGVDVVMMGVVDALVRKSSQEIDYVEVKKSTLAVESIDGATTANDDAGSFEEEKKEATGVEEESRARRPKIELPGAADGTNAREVICAVRKGNVLCTAFHPELTGDNRWHVYFARMVVGSSGTAP